MDVDDNGILSLMDPDTGDTRDDLPLPVETVLADEIRGAISDGKSILVRNMKVQISSYSMMNYSVLRKQNFIIISLIYSASF